MDIEPVYIEIGERIKSCRKALDLTQSDIANAVGLSRPSIANIETGRQRIYLDDALAFSSILGLSLRHLIYGKTTPTKPDPIRKEVEQCSRCAAVEAYLERTRQ